MAEPWETIERRLRGQSAGMRLLLLSLGIEAVVFKRREEHISAELLGRDGAPCMQVQPEHAAALRHIAVSQLDANCRGAAWRSTAGTLEWLLEGDNTLSFEHHPRATHAHALGLDLRDLAAAQQQSSEAMNDDEEGGAEAPRMYG